MKDVKRICSCCNRDVTPLNIGGVSPVNSRRGNCFGLFCADCAQSAWQAVNESPRRYNETPYDNQSTAEMFLLNKTKELWASSIK